MIYIEIPKQWGCLSISWILFNDLFISYPLPDCWVWYRWLYHHYQVWQSISYGTRWLEVRNAILSKWWVSLFLSSMWFTSLFCLFLVCFIDRILFSEIQPRLASLLQKGHKVRMSDIAVELVAHSPPLLLQYMNVKAKVPFLFSPVTTKWSP